MATSSHGDPGSDVSALRRRVGDLEALLLEHTRRAERRRQAAAELAEVGRILAQTLEPEAVSTQIVGHVAALLNARSAALYLLDPVSGHLLAQTTSGAGADQWAPSLAPGTGLAGLALRERRPLASPGALADPRGGEVRPGEGTGAAAHRALLVAPLMIRDRVLGVLAVGAAPGRVFEGQDLELAEAFAQQAALALDNARLFAEEDRRRREAEVIAGLAAALNTSLDLNAILPIVVEGARTLCAGDIARIALRDPGAAHLVYRHWIGPFSGGWRDIRIGAGAGLMGQVMVTGRPVRVECYADDPGLTGDCLALVRQDSMQSALGAPIGTGGRVEGVLLVANQTRRPFTDRDEAMLLRLADHAAIAIRNAGLFAREQSARAALEDSARALRASEERYRTLIESASDVVFSLDTAGVFTSLNAAGERVTGYSRENVLHMRMADLVAPEHQERVRALLEAGPGDGAAVIEADIVARDGRRITLEIGARLLRADGRPAGVQGIARDITERRRLEEQLHQAQKMEAIGSLAGGVAHDFNNLLTVIAGRATLARDRLPPGNPAERDLELIMATAERAAALTQRLLAFSRKQVLELRTLDLNEVLTGLEPMLRRLIGEDVELDIRCAPERGLVRADAGQLEQVVLNLVVNARDAMPRGGRLTLETAGVSEAGEAGGEQVMLAVIDTGIGMDAATRARIFEPFFTTKAVGRGTGLGLATVYGIVTQSGGTVTVDSEPGRGAAFRIYLPRVAGRAEPPAAARPASRGGHETVLLVEDEVHVRTLTRDLLAMSGYTVLEACGAEDAVNICRAHPGPIDLLLTDVVMPHMSGRELGELLAGIRPGLKVLYMSGYTDDAIVRHGVQQSTAALLPKPFTHDALAGKVREVLDASRTGAGPRAATGAE